MKKALLALAVLALTFSGAMAEAWPDAPALTAGPFFEVGGTYHPTSSFTYEDNELSVDQTTAGVPAALTWFDPNSSYGDDYILSATIDFNEEESEMGLLARANSVDNQFYEFSLNPITGYLIINSINGLVPTKIDDAGMTVSGIDSTKQYDMVFKVEGSQLDGWLYDDLGTELAHLSGTDSQYTTGKVGAFTFACSGATGVGGTYIDPQINAIPEPATMSVLALGGVAALIRRRR